MASERASSDRLDAPAIADAAIALADADGVQAVSMRRVGARLGVSGMALYRHVTDRDDLVRRMVVRIADVLPHLPAYETGWRETLEHVARAEWTAFTRHRWLTDVVVSPTRLLDASSAGQTETVLRRLVDAGLSEADAADLFVGVAALVIGIARVTLSDGPGRRVEYAADADAAMPADADTPADAPTPADATESAMPAGIATTTPLVTAFRAEPLDAARGRRLLKTTLTAVLDGVEASVSCPHAT